MFFILNHRNSIIVADKEFLSAIEACDIHTASAILNSGEARLNEYDRTLELADKTYAYTKSDIYTLFGAGYIYNLHLDTEAKEDNGVLHGQFASNDDSKIESDFVEFFSSGSETEIIDSIAPVQSERHNQDDIAIPRVDTTRLDADTEDEDYQPFRSMDETTTTPFIDDIDIDISDNLQSVKPNSVTASMSDKKEKTVEVDFTTPSSSEPIVTDEIDFSLLAEAVGVSPSEYKGFLHDFLEESKRLVHDIKNASDEKSDSALETLKEATLLLHLPHLTSKVAEMQAHVNKEARDKLADDFGHMLTTEELNKYIEQYNNSANDSSTITEYATNVEPFPAYDDVAPLVFDYNISQAVSALMLPHNMIEEFVSDFIRQTKDNIIIMKDAYVKGDISTIKKSAHMLKGVAANLHIKPMVQTLSLLSANDSLHNVPEISKLAISQIKYLETAVK